MNKTPFLYYKISRNLCRIQLTILLFISLPALNQQIVTETLSVIPSADTTEVTDSAYYHSPRKAAIYSAVLPGLGQIYNHKYWKLPIVYAGFGTMAYFITFNNVRFRDFKQAYKDFPDYNLNYPYQLSLEQIDKAMVYYKRWRDLSILGTLGFYLLQILDATVDAHLFNWEVGEDLSFNVSPALMTPSATVGFNTFGLRACVSF